MSRCLVWISPTGAPIPTPALLTSTSRRPYRSRCAATTDLMTSSAPSERGCAPSQPTSATTPNPEQSPTAKGRSRDGLRQRYPAVAQLAPGAGVLTKGPTRMPFLVIDKTGKPVLGAAVALYTLHP